VEVPADVCVDVGAGVPCCCVPRLEGAVVSGDCGTAVEGAGVWATVVLTTQARSAILLRMIMFVVVLPFSSLFADDCLRWGRTFSKVEVHC
jgi:hypothetical protein